MHTRVVIHDARFAGFILLTCKHLSKLNNLPAEQIRSKEMVDDQYLNNSVHYTFHNLTTFSECGSFPFSSK